MTKIIDFSKYCSIKIGSSLCVKILEDVCDIEKEVKIIGYGNNLLVSPSAKNIAILGEKYDYILDKGDFIEVGGASSSGKIYRYFRDWDLGGLEFLRALPGSLGGLVKMNAGMKEYEIKNILDSVCVDGKWIDVDMLSMGYRNTDIKGVILAARFKKNPGFRYELVEIFESMRFTHPKKPSCGSCFKNPKGDFAGRLLESVGLKGYNIRDVAFSKEHANFLINLAKGDFEDAISLIELAKKRVFEEYGIKLQEEVVII
ncbi:UDP-N-acetylmuramate dehydrogenase [Helicobacter cappadocius]|uniref:UDP-N-acetylenolpyruvoylglucosamine reductase n=1 Tax=Helicobacter cappadocius TaxID=3063998 RepID=A0AA90SSM2_9HELI|nr:MULTISPECIES: UDP-N-acetylmuramate dehydrogenase [unclassified Helicobacter]MDO7252936.1 UDP-N-acetylmuramate dehydrogenase [Helicobacter sp. faydin-H75]MDP2539074.1 UDP-N-acetylmuramate dehydrogenase [Helicobacter sp. faydin-H76]